MYFGTHVRSFSALAEMITGDPKRIIHLFGVLVIRLIPKNSKMVYISRFITSKTYSDLAK